MSDKLLSLFESRRFWAAVGGVITVVLSHLFGLDAEQAELIVGLIMAWILGDSLHKTRRGGA